MRTNSTHKRVCLFFTIIFLFYYVAGSAHCAFASQLTILGTGDLQGQLEPSPQPEGSGSKTATVGGISRITSLIQQIKQETQTPVIVLSSGDDLMGKYFQRFGGEAIYSSMDQAGYEILALGNHDFDRGAATLATALGTVSMTPICSDLMIKNTAMAGHCQPYLLRDYQGIQVGFFSLMTENFPVVTISDDIKLKPNHITVARHMVQLLRQQGAQVIIGVTHIGTTMDQQLATHVEGIDLIFGGHSHDYHQNLMRVKNTLIINGGEKGSNLVRLDIQLDEENRIIPASAQYSLIPVTAAVPPHPGVKAHLRHFKEQLPPTTIIGQTTEAWDLSSSALRNHESAVANIITDHIRTQLKVNAVLYNGGAFRGNATLAPGDITSAMIADIDAFESTICSLSIQGKYIKEILEHSASLIGQGGFLQVSGLRFTIDQTEPTQKIEHENGTYRVSQAGERVKNIQILSADNTWQPLKQEQYYRLASNDFLLIHGGDHYFWFKQFGRNICNTYSTMGSVLRRILRAQQIVNPGKPDGRMQIIP